MLIAIAIAIKGGRRKRERVRQGVCRGEKAPLSFFFLIFGFWLFNVLICVVCCLFQVAAVAAELSFLIFCLISNTTQFYLTAMEIQTPPRKKQRLSQELSSSLVNSPVDHLSQHETTTGDDKEQQQKTTTDSDADKNTNTNKHKNANDLEINIETSESQKENQSPFKDNNSLTTIVKNTPLKSDILTARSNTNTPNHSVIAADSSLSPIRSSKLNTATSLNSIITDESPDHINNTNTNGFKQLINRFHSIMDNASDDDDKENEKEKENENENQIENDLDANTESSSELINFTIQLTTLKNQYQSKINALEITAQENAITINNLNNQINDFKTKIENLHLTIQQSSIDHGSVVNENEIAKKEIDILQKSIINLDNQLVIERSKRSKLSAKLNQITELMETVFKSFENMNNKISNLKEENSNFQDIISKNEAKIASFDETLKSELESLAQELYIQYAEKHETKISKLRTAYENKYAKKQALFNERLKLMQEQQLTLQQELSHVKNRLQVETNEKHQLVKLWDEYVALDKKDVDQMSNFVKRLK